MTGGPVQPPPGPRVRVATFPRPLATNPYQRLLLDALARRGAQDVDAAWPLSPWQVWRTRRTVDVVHVHWLELLAFRPGGRWAQARDALRTLRICAALVLLALLRVRLVWTVHNPRPHEARHPLLYALLARTAARAADALLVHSEDAADQVRGTLRPRGPVVVARHGPYTGWYPSDGRPQDEQRRALGLPADAFVFLLFGMVRRNKRVPEAVRAFADVDGDDLRLVVAGAVFDDDLRRELEALAAADPRVVLHLRWIADEEVATFHGAADVAVLNYLEMFSSGALVLAWTYGLPVVAPRARGLEELALPGAAEPFEPGGLGDALSHARRGDPAQRREAALASATSRTWDAMAEGVMRAYGVPGPGGR